MDFEALGKWLSDEIGVALHVSFWVVVSIVGVLLWKLAERVFATRLANANSTIDLLRERLERERTDTALSVTAATQEIEAVQAKQESPGGGPIEKAVPSPPVESLEELDLKEIASIFANKTKVQAQSISKKKIGQWGIVQGRLLDITQLASGAALAGLQGADHRLVFCIFRSLTAELNNAAVGDVLRVAGRIDEVDRNGLTLVDCSLIFHRAA